MDVKLENSEDDDISVGSVKDDFSHRDAEDDISEGGANSSETFVMKYDDSSLNITKSWSKIANVKPIKTESTKVEESFELDNRRWAHAKLWSKVPNPVCFGCGIHLYRLRNSLDSSPMRFQPLAVKK